LNTKNLNHRRNACEVVQKIEECENMVIEHMYIQNFQKIGNFNKFIIKGKMVVSILGKSNLILRVEKFCNYLG